MMKYEEFRAMFLDFPKHNSNWKCRRLLAAIVRDVAVPSNLETLKDLVSDDMSRLFFREDGALLSMVKAQRILGRDMYSLDVMEYVLLEDFKALYDLLFVQEDNDNTKECRMGVVSDAMVAIMGAWF